jgi:plasmid stabilization system protein ParE
MTFEVSAAAEVEAEEAALWYEQQTTSRGDDFADAVTEAYRAIIAMPRAYGRVYPPRLHGEFRQKVLRTYPYHVVYQLLPNRIVVLAVSHHHRRPFYWRSRRVP